MKLKPCDIVYMVMIAVLFVVSLCLDGTWGEQLFIAMLFFVPFVYRWLGHAK